MGVYIEREAVMQKFADHVKRSNNSDFAPLPTWNQAVQIVEDFPAADVRPVVHGKWIFDCERKMHDGWTYRQYHCSTCEFQMIGGSHNFCPNCGADMSEES